VTSDLQYIQQDNRNKQQSRTSSFEIENLLKTAEQVTTYCRSPQETRKSSPTGSVTSSASNAVLTPSRQLTDAEKLRKVILELVDTERAYVKVGREIQYFFPFFLFALDPINIFSLFRAKKENVYATQEKGLSLRVKNNWIIIFAFSLSLSLLSI
jgi:hypothetical protein